MSAPAQVSSLNTEAVFFEVINPLSTKCRNPSQQFIAQDLAFFRLKCNLPPGKHLFEANVEMSTKVISFATQKGGAGKTTLLMLTAAALHNRTDKKILVIDSDPQQSVKTIYKKEQSKKSYDVFAFNWSQPSLEENFEKILTLAKRKYDVILMDVPGNIKGIEMQFSIMYSDILIVPVVASPLDINATVTFLDMVGKMKKERNSPLEVFGVINKRDKTIEHHLLRELAGRGGLQLFYSPLSNLVRYKRFVSTISDITDPGAKDDEFNEYFDEFRTNCFL